MNNLPEHAGCCGRRRSAAGAAFFAAAALFGPFCATAAPAASAVAAQTSATETIVARLPGERYPQTRTRRLRAGDIANWSPAKIRYAINEMYARRGLVFGDLAIRKQFLQFAWYKPVPGQTLRQTLARFTPLERDNARLLADRRVALAGGPTDSAGTARGVRYPQLRTRALRDAELAEMSLAQIRYALNEMYARYGLVFTDPDIQRQFARQRWYKPVPGRSIQTIEQRYFNRYGTTNRSLLAAERDARKQDAANENGAGSGADTPSGETA